MGEILIPIQHQLKAIGEAKGQTTNRLSLSWRDHHFGHCLASICSIKA
ncbi:Uncharacterised protein [Vibrio cholerae]|nr:Uncharacterised protein [Vibrio cholerae]